MAKFPYFFAAGVAFCGISDYAVWYENDRVGEFRDEMDVWVGVTPYAEPGCISGAQRGASVAQSEDSSSHVPRYGRSRVPVIHAKMYKQRADELGKPVTYVELPGLGHNLPLPDYLSIVLNFFEENRHAPVPDGQTRWSVGRVYPV